MQGFWKTCRRALGGLICLLVLAPLGAQATMVRMTTSLGLIDIVLFDAGAPITVNNFLAYVNAGKYDGSFFHRSVRNFIIQGGGFSWVDPTGPVNIAEFPTIVREYSADRPNARGTIAMARIGGQANSASSEWFFNTVDNSTTLGPSNDGGYAVFGRATGATLPTVDAIAALQIQPMAVCYGSTFGTVPIRGLPSSGLCADLRSTHVAIVQSAKVLAAPTDADRIFNYIEAAYAQYARPASPPSQELLGYYARHYTGTDCYAGTKEGQLYALCAPLGEGIVALGGVAEWLAIAAAAGY